MTKLTADEVEKILNDLSNTVGTHRFIIRPFTTPTDPDIRVVVVRLRGNSYNIFGKNWRGKRTRITRAQTILLMISQGTIYDTGPSFRVSNLSSLEYEN